MQIRYGQMDVGVGMLACYSNRTDSPSEEALQRCEERPSKSVAKKLKTLSKFHFCSNSTRFVAKKKRVWSCVRLSRLETLSEKNDKRITIYEQQACPPGRLLTLSKRYACPRVILCYARRRYLDLRILNTRMRPGKR